MTVALVGGRCSRSASSCCSCGPAKRRGISPSRRECRWFPNRHERCAAAARAFAAPTRMIEAVVVVLAAGLVLQLVFYGHGGHSALSDLPRVFLHRGVGPGSLPYIDRAVEYPVVSGVFLYLAALVSPTPLGVLLVTALASAAVCIAITVVLEARFGPRAWRWAIGVPVLLYAFQNWDIFAIGALLVGLFAFERGSDRAAGVAFGFGGDQVVPRGCRPASGRGSSRAGRSARSVPSDRLQRRDVRSAQSSVSRRQSFGMVVAVQLPGREKRDMGERVVLCPASRGRLRATGRVARLPPMSCRSWRWRPR